MCLHRKAARPNHDAPTRSAFDFFRYTHCALSTKVPLGMADLATQKRPRPSGDTSTRPSADRLGSTTASRDESPGRRYLLVLPWYLQ